jgi:uncharacterized membrane protein YhaH (DUF805 family)
MIFNIIIGGYMEWYICAIKKYGVFYGRARRKEFWYFYLLNFIIGIIIGLLTFFPNFGKIFEIISIVYSLALFVPMLAVSVRRLHDINRSGFYLFLALIPLAGIIKLIIYLSQDSFPDENKYGLNPKKNNADIDMKEKNIQKMLIIPALIIIGIVFMGLFYYFGFKSLNSREMFVIFNTSNHNYYLEIETEKRLSQFSLNRHLQINGIRYTFIHKTGKHKLRGATNIFHSERNDDVDFISKMKNIFDEFRIVDDRNNVIWDLNDANSEIIRRMDGPMNIVSWIISLE